MTIETDFAYRKWRGEDVDNGGKIRDALIAAAQALLAHAPDNAARDLAYRHLIESRMWADEAISIGRDALASK